MYRILIAGVLLIWQIALPDMAIASGSSGLLIPNSVHAEGGKIYIHGAFANPDNCSTNTVIVLYPVNDQELDRMLGIALTALVSGKQVEMWFTGCVTVPWFPSAPQAVTITLRR